MSDPAPVVALDFRQPGQAASPGVEVRRSARRRRTASARRDGDLIVVLVPAGMAAADEQRCVADLVGKVLAKEARARGGQRDEDLADRAARLSERHLAPVLGQVPLPNRISWVSNQDHRWGSCTIAARTIRLSDRLQPMPGWVVDYVILHELTHLVHADHSAAFWRLVDRYPRAALAKGYLRGWSDARGLSPDDLGDVD